MSDGGWWDLAEVMREFPETAETMLLDRYLVDRASSSVRVFRVYRGAPAHFHRNCDETLYVLSGRGTFWIGDVREEREFGPGQLLCFPRGVVHATPTLLEEPVVFLAIDSPRREPRDVVFVGDAAGAEAGFIAKVDEGS